MALPLRRLLDDQGEFGGNGEGMSISGKPIVIVSEVYGDGWFVELSCPGFAVGWVYSAGMDHDIAVLEGGRCTVLVRGAP